MSAGYYPQGGRSCPEEAVSAAKTIGIDLTQHHSSIISEEVVRQADLIFTFDEENRRVLITRYLYAKKKIYHLGLLSQDTSVIIKDPYGGTVSDFKAVYHMIIQALSQYADFAGQKGN